MTLVLLDTNTYIRLAKRIRPLLGVKFGQRDYVLTVLKDVEDEVRRSRTLRFRFPWFDDEAFGTERDATQIRLSATEKTALDNARSVLRGHVLSDVDRYTTGGRQPPSDTDCRVLAKMKAAKKVDNDLIRDIYDALERNGDLTATWSQAKHTEFIRIFGPRRE